MIDITIFDGLQDRIGENRTFSFDQFRKFLQLNYTTTNYERPPLFFGGWFDGGGKETKNILFRSVLTYDIDKCFLTEAELRTFIISLDKYMYFFYTTKKSKKNDLRFRLMFFLNEHLEKESYSILAKNFAVAKLEPLMKGIDKCSYDANRLLYLPFKPDKGYSFIGMSNEGEFINPHEFATVTEYVKTDEEFLIRSLIPRPLQLTKDEVVSYLKLYPAEDTDYHSWLEVGMALHHQFQANDEGYALFKSWSLKDSRVGSEYDTEQTINDLKYKYYSTFKADSTKPITFATIIHRIKSKKSNLTKIPKRIEIGNFLHYKISKTKTVKILSTYENFLVLMKYENIEVNFDLATKDIINNKNYDSNSFITTVSSLLTLNDMDKSNAKPYIHLLAQKSKINTWKDFILSKPWDGVNRTYEFFATVEVVDVPVKTRDLYLLKWLQQMIYLHFSQDKYKSPRYVLVFKGKERRGKTSWFRKLVPQELQEKYIAEGMKLEVGNDMSVKACIKKVFVELGELMGTFKRSDSNDIKMFFGRKMDILNEKFLPEPVEYKRTTSFFASLNDDEFLNQQDEHTRFLILPVYGCNINHEIDMQQLYAEIYHNTDWLNFELSNDETKEQILINETFKQQGVLEEQFLRYFDVNIENKEERYNKTQILEIMGYEKKDITFNRLREIDTILKKYKALYRSNEKSYYLKRRTDFNL
jgi:hypothetical protein